MIIGFWNEVNKNYNYKLKKPFQKMITIILLTGTVHFMCRIRVLVQIGIIINRSPSSVIRRWDNWGLFRCWKKINVGFEETTRLDV